MRCAPVWDEAQRRAVLREIRMTKSKLAVVAIFIFVVAAVVGMQNLQGQAEKPSAGPAAIDPVKATASGEFRGVSMTMHHRDPNHPYDVLIDEIAATGANMLSLVVTGWQENCSSTSIFVDVRKAPTPELIKQVIATAHKKGLAVSLMPIVLLENGREGEWRGKIKPENWDDWWEDYNAYVLHYAKIVEEAKADVFIIGSELVSTETQTERWKQLIAEVRKVYHGRLSYSSNWDHYRVVNFWDDLDLIGMTTYYDLTGGKKATLPTLLEAWKPIKKEILEWQAKINRPLLFTEVGWPNQITCAQFPWDYYRSPKDPDPIAQANCFEAFFQTWAGEKNVAGTLVWEWRSDTYQKCDESDTSYNPAGKPALAVIKKYFNVKSDANAPKVEIAPAPAPTPDAAPTPVTE